MKNDFNNEIDAIHALREECKSQGFDTSHLSDDEIIKMLGEADVEIGIIPRNEVINFDEEKEANYDPGDSLDSRNQR